MSKFAIKVKNNFWIQLVNLFMWLIFIGCCINYLQIFKDNLGLNYLFYGLINKCSYVKETKNTSFVLEITTLKLLESWIQHFSSLFNTLFLFLFFKIIS